MNYLKVRTKLIVMVMVILGILPSLLSAATTGKIAGRITDTAGETLTGVNVFLENTGMGAATDANGYYMIINVPPGDYSVQFMMMGYEGRKINNVNVRSDHTTTLDQSMKQTMLEGESVVVSATREIIDMDRTSTEASVSADQLERMPVQNISDVLNLQAGVVDGHFRGGRSNEVSYLVDGIPINDVFSQEASMVIENELIQELKIISGTFNAEYGQAQSGIVEIITKSGSVNFSSNFKITSGDYFSNNENIFRNVDDFGLHYKELSFSARGPLPGQTSYLFNYRLTDDEGYLYGRDFFERSVGHWIQIKPDTTGFSPMADNYRQSLFLKLTFPFSGRDKLSLNATIQDKERGVYEHDYSYNPLGNSRIYENSGIYYLTWNHLINQNTYWDMTLSFNDTHYDRYLFEDMYDERYSVDNRVAGGSGNFFDYDEEDEEYVFFTQTLKPGNSFNSGGTDMRYFKRRTTSSLFKFDFTRQLNRLFDIKTGVEIRSHELYLHDINLQRNPTTGFEIQPGQAHTTENQEYTRKPLEAAYYAQTKLETNTVILNAGLRLDYFDANSDVLIDLTRPTQDIETNSRKSETITKLSPRLGFAYPISANGVLHVSYGHFFQIPPFENLYTNPDFKWAPDFEYPYGNADLKPQETVAYEIGLQQELSSNIMLEATAYYKDIRNLLGTELVQIAAQEQNTSQLYGRFVNRDYGQVKGFTLMLEHRLVYNIGGSIDYTYQVARGNASDPRSVLQDQQQTPPVESEKQLVPLDWDQTHTLNLQLNFQPARSTSATFVGKLGSGMPYTPTYQVGDAYIRNNDRKPGKLTFDLFVSHRIQVRDQNVNFTLKIYNIFDRLNEKDVYSSTGRATYTVEGFDGESGFYNTKDEIINRPDWYSAPRRILLGIAIEI